MVELMDKEKGFQDEDDDFSKKRKQDKDPKGKDDKGKKHKPNTTPRSGPDSKCHKHPNGNHLWKDCKLNPRSPNYQPPGDESGRGRGRNPQPFGRNHNQFNGFGRGRGRGVPGMVPGGGNASIASSVTGSHYYNHHEGRGPSPYSGGSAQGATHEIHHFDEMMSGGGYPPNGPPTPHTYFQEGGWNPPRQGKGRGW